MNTTTTIVVRAFDRYTGHPLPVVERVVADFPSQDAAVADAMAELAATHGPRLGGRPWVGTL